MPLSVGWPDILLRLVSAMVAGALIGLDRGEHGRPAGLRTMLLASLAACLAMIQANLLLATANKPETSFVTLDMMRLPLGILSGVGIIGAGVIIRRESGVVGITTAASLWFVTVLGLCFGAGLIAVGFVALVFGLVIVAALRPLEAKLRRDCQGTLTILETAAGPGEEEVRRVLTSQGFRISSSNVIRSAQSGELELTWKVTWRATERDHVVPEFVRTLSLHAGVSKVAWALREI